WIGNKRIDCNSALEDKPNVPLGLERLLPRDQDTRSPGRKPTQCGPRLAIWKQQKHSFNSDCLVFLKGGYNTPFLMAYFLQLLSGSIFDCLVRYLTNLSDRR